MYDIVIVGAGVHGSFLAADLVFRGITDPDKLLLIDPWGAALRLWHRNTRRCGMHYLRSTSSHNMTDDFHALRAFARVRGYGAGDFLQPYSRPRLELFNEHTDHILAKAGVPERVSRGRAKVLQRDASGWVVHTSDAAVRARSVILAFGRSEQPHIPAWAQPQEPAPSTAPSTASPTASPTPRSPEATIRHLFSTAAPPAEGLGPQDRVAVVGGGISGVQSALALSEDREEAVTLITRHPITVAHFDSDPCFMGPRCLEDFLALPTAAERLAAIRNARTPGTIPWDVAQSLEEAEREGRVRVVQDDVVRAEVSGGAAVGPDAAPRDAAAHGGVELTLRQARKRERYDRVILATGFEARPPADGVVAATASAEGLPVNSEGYPALDRSLRWGKGLYVASALAELELGPMAPNIYGAHAAARRILPALAGDEQAKRVLFPWNPIRELGASA